MEDYNEIVREIILKYYAPQVEANWTKIYKTTADIYEMVIGVIPMKPFTPNDVFSIMTELQFQFEKVEDTIQWAMYEKELITDK